MTTAAATPLDLLVDAKQLVMRDFCMGALARDAFGNGLDSAIDRRACSWCASGALCHVAGARDYHQLISGDSRTGEAGKRAMQLLEEAAREVGGESELSVADLNDEYGDAMAEDLYDRAIRAARIEQGVAA